MQGLNTYDFHFILRDFCIDGRFLSIQPFGSGHINETYLSEFESAEGVVGYVHQRINPFVFKEPEKVMANIERVTRHARQKLSASGADPERGTLNIVPTRDGRSYLVDEAGNTWRTYRRIKGARTYDRAEDARQVYGAGYAFGSFQQLVADLPGERLFETIPDFHNTPRRYAAFAQAVALDSVNRAADAGEAIAFLEARQGRLGEIQDGLASGRLPERIAHNDTKFNNVMIDDESGEGICVIDLDTVMPGSVLFDFGDAVRLGAATAAEDEPELARVGFDLERFEGLAAGYLDATKAFLTQAEIDLLPYSAWLMTLEVGMRFLTDYLQGDVYFRTHRPGHNLERARTQLKLAAEMEQAMEAMQAVTARLTRGR